MIRSEQPSAQRGDLGEYGDAEDVEVLADGQQRAGDGEHEDADEVERVLDGGAEQLLEHTAFLRRGFYRVGLPVVKSQVRNRSSSCCPLTFSASRMKSAVSALP